MMMNKLFSISSLLIVSCFIISSCNNQKEAETNKVIVTTKDSSKQRLTELPPPPPETEVPSQIELQKQIQDMEKVLYAAKTADLNQARKMIRLYDTYYKNYPKDWETPDYLFKAGEISESINQYNQAVKFYNRACYEYNDNFKYRSLVLFRLANVYDYKLNDYVHAKQIYMQVKEQYPKTQLAKDADAAIKMMGKSDQDMVREFERKNAAKK